MRRTRIETGFWLRACCKSRSVTEIPAAGGCRRDRTVRPGESRPGEMLHGIDGLGILAQFEMELRLGDLARRARLGDDLTTLHHVAARHHHFVIVGVGRDIAVGMAHQHQIAEAR